MRCRSSEVAGQCLRRFVELCHGPRRVVRRPCQVPFAAEDALQKGGAVAGQVSPRRPPGLTAKHLPHSAKILPPDVGPPSPMLDSVFAWDRPTVRAPIIALI